MTGESLRQRSWKKKMKKRVSFFQLRDTTAILRKMNRMLPLTKEKKKND